MKSSKTKGKKRIRRVTAFLLCMAMVLGLGAQEVIGQVRAEDASAVIQKEEAVQLDAEEWLGANQTPDAVTVSAASEMTAAGGSETRLDGVTPTEETEPGTPETPTEGTEPGTPETPTEGTEPGTPETPTEGTEPGTPETPTEGTEPGTPETPEEGIPTEPGTPETPEEGTPTEPGTPETPEEGTPTEPEEPGIPETPADSDPLTKEAAAETPEVLSDASLLAENTLPGYEWYGEILDRGSFTNDAGDEFTWTVLEDEDEIQTLVVSGNGALPDWGAYYKEAWKEYTRSITNVFFEEGITSIGKGCFYNGTNLSYVSLPSTLRTIKSEAFGYCESLRSIELPEGLETLENAFIGNTKISNVVLPESLKTLSIAAFSSSAGTIHIPAGVKTLTSGQSSVANYTVAGDNPNIISFKECIYTLNGDTATLMHVNRDAKAALTIPNPTVTELFHSKGIAKIKTSNWCMLQASNTTSVVFEANTTAGANALSGSKVESVVFQEGSHVNGSAFNSANRLWYADLQGADNTRLEEYTFFSCPVQTVILPEGLKNLDSVFMGAYVLETVVLPEGLETIAWRAFQDASSLKSIRIPENVTSLGVQLFYGCVSLEALEYDAADAAISNSQGGAVDSTFTGAGSFRLIIGDRVGRLRSSFYLYPEAAGSITFEGKNWFTIEDGAFERASGPLEDLAGDFYVDEQGVLYRLEQDGTASVVYVSPDCPESITIPASVSSEDGTIIYPVSAVEQNALIEADGLTGITFADPEAVTRLEPYALANCPSLTSVNGKTAAEEALATFTAVSGISAASVFYNTGLTFGSGGSGSEGNGQGQKNLTVTVEDENVSEMKITVPSSEHSTQKWVPSEVGTEDTGRWQLLTGDTMKVNISTSNTSAGSDQVYRVYFRTSGAGCNINMEPGNDYTYGTGENKVVVSCVATEFPDVFYVEFTPPVGMTVSFDVTAVYPSPSSPGGGLSVWGMILDKEDAEENAEKNIDPEAGETIEGWWTTKQDPFTVTKSSQNPTDITLIQGADGALHPSADLVWQVKLQRSTDSSSDYGKDYASGAEYRDVITLPEGVEWDPDIEEALQKNNTHRVGNILYAGNIPVVTVSGSGSGITRSNYSMEWDEEEKTVAIRWTIKKSDPSVEMGTYTNVVTLDSQALVAEEIETGEEGVKVTNTVDVTVHYTHGGDSESLNASADKSLKLSQGSLTLAKSATGVTYLGEDVTYTLTVRNNGSTAFYEEPGNTGGNSDPENCYYLADTLSERTYISPENMQKMFGNEYGDFLTITIRYAALRDWEPVTDVTGEDTAYTHAGNTYDDKSTFENTLTIRRTEGGQYQVEVKPAEEQGTENPKIYTAGTVAEALQEAGYAVTTDAVYRCEWRGGGSLTLKSGESRRFLICATVKDTFTTLDQKDAPIRHPNAGNTPVSNSAGICTPEGGNYKNANSSQNVKREAEIRKSVWDKNGNAVEGQNGVTDGEVLRYELDFILHSNDVSYENLPMVDDLYGTQSLLVPVEKNEGNNTLNGLKSHTYQNKAYYILTPGTYEDVAVGYDAVSKELLIADTITVKEADSITIDGETHTFQGLHTQIKWYFSELDHELEVSYLALVDTEWSEHLAYSIGNVVWMNDRPGYRLYHTIWGDGSLIEFDKDIVTERAQDDPANDQLDSDDYSEIEEGGKVTYRLTLDNEGGAERTLTGEKLADALPYTYKAFEWNKDTAPNVSLDCVPVGAEVSGLENWAITEKYEYAGISGERQYITWPEESCITFQPGGKVYLYITLEFPEGDQWEAYVDRAAGNILDNTMYVERFSSSVTHELKEDARVLLQKGVYAMAVPNSRNALFTTGSDLHFYNNRDTSDRNIIYYVALYNDSSRRFYLNTLYDVLPEGFTYEGMLRGAEVLNDGSFDSTAGSSDIVHETTTPGGTDPKSYINITGTAAGNSGITYRSAVIRDSEAENGVLQFTIVGTEGEYPLKYDEERGQYYLDRGECLTFGYVCDIGTSAETDPEAVNRIAMPYSDYQGNGVQTIGEDEIAVSNRNPYQFSELNDGDYTWQNDKWMESNYGLSNTAAEGNGWLVSDVSVKKGGIVPGINKTTASYTDSATGTTKEYKGFISPDSTVNWEIRLENDGDLSITDYTFTDVMPYPFGFTGEVSIDIYSSRGDKWKADDVLLTFPDRNAEGGEKSLLIGGQEVKFDGTWVEYRNTGSSWNEEADGFSLALERDEASGDEILKLRLSGTDYAIPEGGYMVISLSSRNLSRDYRNATYINQAVITPTQEFTSAQHGTIIWDENEKPISVQSSSPVTVASGYATSAYKTVTELDKDGNLIETNTASSTDSVNTILLPGTDSRFRYTLNVNNITGEAMSKLVVIDNLPGEDDIILFTEDVPRGSAFNVKLAADPNFTVTVTTKDGEKKELTAEQYSIEYSSDKIFGKPQSSDWRGENNEKWNADEADARAFRIIIDDSSAGSGSGDGSGSTDALIPADALVTISFDAEIDGTAPAGEIAWNSFGYHYALAGESNIELEALSWNVGVKVPSVPQLYKELVDESGAAVKAEEKLTFSFLVYTGDAISGSYETEEKWIEALDEAGCTWEKFDVTVAEGESQSEALQLTGSDGWKWVNGEEYTIVELPTGNDYEFRSFNKHDGISYTFTYDPASSQVIQAYNTYKNWALDVKKHDLTDAEKLLNGAVFALYSPNQDDQLEESEIPDEYQELKPKLKLELPEEGTDKKTTWYLCRLGTTDGNGELTFAQLSEDSYYLLELKAPEGYLLNENAGQLVEREDAVDGVLQVSITNTEIYELPSTGGVGTHWFTLGGSLLMTGSVALLLYGYRRKRKAER